MADTGGLQWFQLKPPLRIVHAPNLLITTSYTQCVIVGLSTGKTFTFSFEITIMVLKSRL